MSSNEIVVVSLPPSLVHTHGKRRVNSSFLFSKVATFCHSEATKQKDFSSNHFDFSFLFFSLSFTQLLILHMRFNLGVLFK
jgi:hypothetical protein